MKVTSGCAGLRENVARHARPVSSGQVMVTVSSARVRLIGPGRTPLTSSGTAAAAAGSGTRTRIRIRIARKAFRMATPF